MKLERWAYESDMVEIGPFLGSIVQLVDPKPRDKAEKKNPIGFAATGKRKQRIGGRVAGTWPKVGRL